MEINQFDFTSRVMSLVKKEFSNEFNETNIKNQNAFYRKCNGFIVEGLYLLHDEWKTIFSDKDNERYLNRVRDYVFCQLVSENDAYSSYAFTVLYKKYKHFFKLRIETYYLDRNIPFSFEQIPDIRDAVWELFFERIPKYKPEESSFATWGKTVAYNILKGDAKKPESYLNASLDDVAPDSPGNHNKGSNEQDKDTHLDLIKDPESDPSKTKALHANLLYRLSFTIDDPMFYPHELLVFVLKKLWTDYDYVLEEFSDMTIGNIYDRMIDDYCFVIHEDRDTVEAVFKQYHIRLDKPLDDILSSRAQSTRKMCQKHLQTKLKDIELKVLLGAKPKSRLTAWCNNVSSELAKRNHERLPEVENLNL